MLLMLHKRKEEELSPVLVKPTSQPCSTVIVLSKHNKSLFSHKNPKVPVRSASFQSVNRFSIHFY